MPIPVIDLFAGPGGLAEGFASLLDTSGRPLFRIGISIERENSAYRTLLLRAVFRRIRHTSAAHHYYKYMRGEMSAEAFREVPVIAAAFEQARHEVKHHELGRTDTQVIDAEIQSTLRGHDRWVLIGGPPCQAYSLAGRARRTNDRSFKKDKRHFLYQEYLRIIRVHRPSVFVMENVKGILSSRHAGARLFTRILSDLSSPRPDLEYDIRSFVRAPSDSPLTPEDYVIESERFGIPQSRHRVILMGVRKDCERSHGFLKETVRLTTADAIGDMPRIRSRLSRGTDSPRNWHAALQKSRLRVDGWGDGTKRRTIASMAAAAQLAVSLIGTGERFVPYTQVADLRPNEFRRWVIASELGGICQHEARAHMESDLARYLFAAVYANLHGFAPKLPAFPRRLIPAHRNAKRKRGKASIPFPDRFRVQCAEKPSSTIVSHIAKDGHYYIHYDPVQCRSLTVREAARLQTFPDDYFFEGTRTEQYVQVGNAVPPLLARKLAEVVAALVAEPAIQASTNVRAA